ncbi:MAG: tetratricopeptide repeat protein [Gemmatimonadetes bacterium]|nr:tetratricopeptide repeat protein [Gemmatimonadota bacterium]
MSGPSLTSSRDRDVLRALARRIDPSDAGAHNNLGVLFHNKGLAEEAVQAFTKALELDPQMQVAQRNLEIAYTSSGYYDRRVAELKERLRVRADDRDARWELGRAYAQLGESEDAIREFQELLRYDDQDLGAIVQLGLAEKAVGRLDDARRWFVRALEMDPTSSVVAFYLGETLYNQGLAEEALVSLQHAIQLNPENPDAHYLLGFIYGDMGRPDDALAASKRAVQLNPALSRAQANLAIDKYDPGAYEALRSARSTRALQRMTVTEGDGLAHYNLGLAFRQKGYFAEALREYAMAIERGEDRPLVLQATAEVHLLRQDPAAALAIYDQLLADRQDSPKLWNEHGVALHQQGRHAEAAADYQRALAVDPRYALASNNLGVALFHAGDRDAAIGAFRAALTANPGFAKARLNLALLLSRAKRAQLALEAYRQVLVTESDNAVAWNGVGLVLADLRKFEDARNAFARAIQTRPDFAEAHYNMSFALSNLGDFDGALRETRRALELDPYYVPQKFSLAIDLEYEDPDLSVVPDLGGEQRMSGEVGQFAFDPTLLDTLFKELAPPPAPAPTVVMEVDPYAMAADYLTKGLYDRATAETSRAMARGADVADGYALFGDVLYRQGAYGDALERFRAARQARPGHMRALRGEAQALMMLSRGAEARLAAEQILEAAPEDVDALMLAASARFEAGDPAAALEALDLARRLAPQRAEVLRWIGNIARSVGDLEGAIAAYRHALSLDRDFAAVRFELARLLVRKSSWDEAERELVTALDTVPTYAEATLELASLKRVTGRAQEAVNLLADLLQRDPYNFEALIALGETLLTMGRAGDARTAFTRVLRFDATHAGAIFYDGVLAAGDKRFREAIAAWQRVIDLEPAGEYARRARREMRTAQDLLQVFGRRAGGGG